MYVLVIDDDQEICKNILELLSYEGHTADGARTVAEGLRRAAAQIPDVVICDWKLPDGTGADVIDHLGNIPIILVTATDVRIMSAQHLSRAAGCIMKPFIISDLIKAIDQLMVKQ